MEKQNDAEYEQQYQADSYEELPEIPDRVEREDGTYELIHVDYEENYGEEGHRVTLTEQSVLSSEDTSQIPTRLERDGIIYYLVEDSISVDVSRTETREGITIEEKYVTYSVPDNDIDRLQRQITNEAGEVLELISVDYVVTQSTADGVPTEYAANCRYAANVAYTEEIPVEWTATATYSGTRTEEVLEKVTATAQYSLIPVEEQPFPYKGIAAAATGVILIGAFFIFFLFRRRTDFKIYYQEYGSGKQILLGRTKAVKRENVWYVQIPQKITKSVDINFLILKPSNYLFKQAPKPVKVVSEKGFIFMKLEKEMMLKDLKK